MRAIFAVVIVLAGCGAPSATGNGGNGNGGSGGSSGVGGNAGCAMKGSPLDCNRACSNYMDICKDASTKWCLDVCLQVQSYCAQMCKLVSSDEDFAVFGCLAANDSCAGFSSCADACVTRTHPAPVPRTVDLGSRD